MPHAAFQTPAETLSDRLADVLIALEGDIRDVAFTPIALRQVGQAYPQPRVLVRAGGGRFPLTADEAITAAVCLELEKPYRGAGLVARSLQAAAVEAAQLARRQSMDLDRARAA